MEAEGSARVITPRNTKPTYRGVKQFMVSDARQTFSLS